MPAPLQGVDFVVLAISLTLAAAGIIGCCCLRRVVRKQKKISKFKELKFSDLLIFQVSDSCSARPKPYYWARVRRPAHHIACVDSATSCLVNMQVVPVFLKVRDTGVCIMLPRRRDQTTRSTSWLSMRWSMPSRQHRSSPGKQRCLP